jgi:hypothetical protein
VGGIIKRGLLPDISEDTVEWQYCYFYLRSSHGRDVAVIYDKEKKK